MTSLDGMPPLGRIPPLPGSADFFKHIRVEDNFKQFVHREYEDEAGFEVDLSDAKLGDAHRLYLSDIALVEQGMKTPPSHFTHSGFLVYWLHRLNPVANEEFGDSKKYRPSSQKKARDFLVNYGHAYLAFGLGFGICLYFEREAAGKRPLPNPDSNYLKAACHLMKYKSISPHAIGFIYRSLFL